MFLREAYAASVERFVAQRTGVEDAGAVCEGVWNDVYRALPTYTADRSSRSWLLELARAKLEPLSPRAKALTSGRARFGSQGAMQWSVNRRDFPALERAIAGLPEDDREVRGGLNGKESPGHIGLRSVVPAERIKRDPHGYFRDFSSSTTMASRPW